MGHNLDLLFFFLLSKKDLDAPSLFY